MPRRSGFSKAITRRAGSTRRGCGWRRCRTGRHYCRTRFLAPPASASTMFVLPGVPQIMQAIFSELKHRLKGGAAVLSRSVSCTLAEGTIAKDLGELQTRYADLEIGSYPYFRRRDFGVTLVIRGTVRERIGAAVEELKTLIRSLGGDPQEGAAEE